jgi:pSer/pThr/pTyr-binding forkhead associated (FHA) protein
MGSEAPADFVPLRLELQSAEAPPVNLEIARPSALVGRHTVADVRLGYADVSRRHCRLDFQDGFWHIVDLNSLNGLYVNNERIQEAVLQEGDVIRLGSVKMVVQALVAAEAAQENRMAPLTGVLRSIADNLG